MKRGSIQFAVAAVVALLMVHPASAHHELTLIHQQPIAAIAGHDLALSVSTFSSCAPFCEHVDVTLHYLRPGGSESVLEASTTEFTPVGVAVFVLPAAEIAPPALTYWLEASQIWSIFSFDRHHAWARAPEAAAYSLRVAAS